MTQVIEGKSLVAGVAAGTLVISQEPFSFFGGFDFASGQIVDPRLDVFGQNLRGKIFAYPRGKGSSSTAGVILEALRQGVAPLAIINVESEKILAVGVIVAEIAFGWSLPIISITEADYGRLRSGDQLEIRDGRIMIQTPAPNAD